MMLIDADALEREGWSLCRTFQKDKDTMVYEVKKPSEFPTIEERKKGFWCITPDGKLVCSNCYNNPTNRIIVDGSLIYDMTPIKKRMRYCPNCGSYNGGEERDKG